MFQQLFFFLICNDPFLNVLCLMILNDPNSNFLSSLMHLLQLFFFPDGQSFSLIWMTLLSCFLGKSGKMRSSSSKKAFQSYNQTITSFPASDLVVASVRTGTGDSRICVSLSNEGGPIESSKVQFYILCPSKTAFQSNIWTFTYFPTWKPVVVPVETGIGDSRIHIYLFSQGGQIISSKETWHRKNNSTSYVQVLQSTNKVLLYFHFSHNHRFSDFILFCYEWRLGGSFTFKCLKVTQTLVSFKYLQKNI